MKTKTTRQTSEVPSQGSTPGPEQPLRHSSEGSRTLLRTESLSTQFRKQSSFIRRKRTSSTSSPTTTNTELDAFILGNQQTELQKAQILNKFHNRSPRRLLRSARQRSFFDEENHSNAEATPRGMDDDDMDDIDDDTAETGYGTWKSFRENHCCRWGYFVLHDVIFAPPLVCGVVCLLGLIHVLSSLDAQHIGAVKDTDSSLYLTTLKWIPGKRIATEWKGSLGEMWHNFIDLLPNGMKDPVKLLSPGIVFSKFFGFFMDHLYTPFMEEMHFNEAGFTNRVSITINTLEEQPSAQGVHQGKQDDRAYRQKLVMRTVKEMGLDELLPNKSAHKLMQTASESIELTEDGPVVPMFHGQPCGGFFGKMCCRKLCCLKKERPEYKKGGCCCCLPRINSWFCGVVKHHYLYCDPILRFHGCDAGLKKKIEDQIKNQLSEATTGHHFLGYEMGLPYHKVEYVWAMTFEQPIDLNKASETRNRKYRILLARKELVEFAGANDSWDVFTTPGPPGGATQKYFDRRWVHLRTIGQIVKKKQELVENPISMIQGIGNPKDLKVSQDWLNTFFVGTIEVVAPRPPNIKLIKRAWESGHPYQEQHKAWATAHDRKPLPKDTLIRQASSGRRIRKTMRVLSANRATGEEGKKNTLKGKTG